MRESLAVGMEVCLRDFTGSLRADYGIGQVIASDLSTVSALFPGDTGAIKVNAGSLKWNDKTLSLLTQEEWRSLQAAARQKKLASRTVADLQCNTCLWWRPPFDTGPGNCHNETVKQLTNIGGETYAPPTPATWGCVSWESKAQPENGDDSDA